MLPALVHQGPTATLGLYVNSGSVYEEPHETGALTSMVSHSVVGWRRRMAGLPVPGCETAIWACEQSWWCLAGFSHLLEYMGFKTTTHRTHFRLTREVRCIGPGSGTPHANSCCCSALELNCGVPCHAGGVHWSQCAGVSFPGTGGQRSSSLYHLRWP